MHLYICIVAPHLGTLDVQCTDVAKMASHALFQYNILAIDDTHNTWTNIIVKINIPRLLGSSDDKEKIGVARPEGPPLRCQTPKRSLFSTGSTDGASEHTIGAMTSAPGRISFSTG